MYELKNLTQSPHATPRAFTQSTRLPELHTSSSALALAWAVLRNSSPAIPQIPAYRVRWWSCDFLTEAIEGARAPLISTNKQKNNQPTKQTNKQTAKQPNKLAHDRCPDRLFGRTGNCHRSHRYLNCTIYRFDFVDKKKSRTCASIVLFIGCELNVFENGAECALSY